MQDKKGKTVLDNAPVLKHNPFNFDSEYPMEIEFDKNKEYNGKKGCYVLGIKKRS